MKKKMILILFLAQVLLQGCSTTPTGSKEAEIKEFSTPSGDIKITLDPAKGYTYRNTKYGISFSFGNPKRFSLLAKELEDFPTGKRKDYSGWGSGGIVRIRDSHNIANVYIWVMRKVDQSEMERLIDSWNREYHMGGRITVVNLKKYVETLELPNRITAKRTQYIDRNPDGSKRMFQVAYVEIPNNRFLVIQASNYGTYGDNTKELLELIKSIQLISASAEISETVPFTSNLNILPPDPNLPKEIAAFSGIWEGKWGGRIASRLAVETIDGKKAIVVYGWADHPDSRFLGGWVREKAKVGKDGTIKWGALDEPQFTFTMGKDLKTIEGKREFGGSISRVTMTKKE